MSQFSQNKRCVHFYACICAFASDAKLSEEFSYYINMDQNDFSIPKSLTTVLQTNDHDKLVGIGKKICTKHILNVMQGIYIF